MGTIKIEFNLPEFDKRLDINLTIMKDGEVIATSSPDNSSYKSIESTQANEERTCNEIEKLVVQQLSPPKIEIAEYSSSESNVYKNDIGNNPRSDIPPSMRMDF